MRKLIALWKCKCGRWTRLRPVSIPKPIHDSIFILKVVACVVKYESTGAANHRIDVWLNELRQPLGLRDGIVIDECDDFPLSHTYSDVSGD